MGYLGILLFWKEKYERKTVCSWASRCLTGGDECRSAGWNENWSSLPCEFVLGSSYMEVTPEMPEPSGLLQETYEDDV